MVRIIGSGLKRFGGSFTQAVSEQGHKRLSPAVNSETWVTKCDSRSVVKQRRRRELMELRFFKHQRQAGVAAGHRVADPVAFHRIKEKYLVRFGDGLILPDMANVNTAIRKHKLSGNGAFFRALMWTCSSAVRIPYRNGRRRQESVNIKFRYLLVFVLDAHELPPRIDSKA